MRLGGGTGAGVSAGPEGFGVSWTCGAGAAAPGLPVDRRVNWTPIGSLTC